VIHAGLTEVNARRGNFLPHNRKTKFKTICTVNLTFLQCEFFEIYLAN